MKANDDNNIGELTKELTGFSSYLTKQGWQVAVILLLASMFVSWQSGIMAGIELMAIGGIFWFVGICFVAFIMNLGVEIYV